MSSRLGERGRGYRRLPGSILAGNKSFSNISRKPINNNLILKKVNTSNNIPVGPDNIRKDSLKIAEWLNTSKS